MVPRLPFLVRRPFLCVLIPVDAAAGSFNLAIILVLFPQSAQRSQRPRRHFGVYLTNQSGDNFLVPDQLDFDDSQQSQKYSMVHERNASCHMIAPVEPKLEISTNRLNMASRLSNWSLMLSC